ncbi:MAG: CRTAC1 family protein [Acidobacteriota bacterium]
MRLARSAPALHIAAIAIIAGIGVCRAAPAGKSVAGRSASYIEVTREAGIDSLHRHGGTGRKYYVETVPPGACWLDYDGDDWWDLYVVQSGPLPGRPRPDGTPHSKLYRNLGDGTFEDVTKRAGVANASGYGAGCTAGDYDNDGDSDLYVTNFGNSVLYQNAGDGTFEDVTKRAGVANGLYAASASWADYDLDGRLDLYVTNYVDFTMDDEKYCGDIRTGRRSYCHPDAYIGVPDALYHNEGNGVFKNVAPQAGIVDPNGKGLGVVWFDFDHDGDVDLYVANDATPNMLYRNEGNGRFVTITLLSGVCCSEDGRPESGMGTDSGDADGDGWPDLIVTNLSNEVNQIYRNLEGSGVFSIESYPSGLGEKSLLMTGWGVDLFDHDNDGDLDLIVTNGHPMDDIEEVSDILTHSMRPFLFENQGGGRFREIGQQAGDYFRAADVGRGLSTADFDNDGDRDLFFSPNNRRARLLRNDGGSGAGHWITVRLRGVRANRDAIGARVELTAGGRLQVQEVRSSSSYLSQNDMRLHFGLGAAKRVDRLTIHWPTPDHRVEKVGPLPVDRFITIREGKGMITEHGPGVGVE